jgi:hypothetical protein
MHGSYTRQSKNRITHREVRERETEPSTIKYISLPRSPRSKSNCVFEGRQISRVSQSRRGKEGGEEGRGCRREGGGWEKLILTFERETCKNISLLDVATDTLEKSGSLRTSSDTNCRA